VPVGLGARPLVRAADAYSRQDRAIDKKGLASLALEAGPGLLLAVSAGQSAGGQVPAFAAVTLTLG
jgi:hypothetical protein